MKIGIALVLAVFPTILLSACMKQQRYQCLNSQGIKMEEGCNKTRDQIKETETAENRKCIVLP